MDKVESVSKRVDLSIFGERLGIVQTGKELLWELICNTHGIDSTVEALPHDIETDPKKLREWIDLNINPPKCSTLCHKHLGGVSSFISLGAEPRRRIYAKPSYE